MAHDFAQIEWDALAEDDCRQLVRLAVREDLDRGQDWTTLALVDPSTRGRAAIVAREPGVLAGTPVLSVLVDEMQLDVACRPLCSDGQAIEAGTAVAELSGAARDLLVVERIALNFLGRLSGVATLTSRFVEQVAGTGAKIYDTRKTTPGWRRLEKYAVRCGGGMNHRTGLFDAVLIKDNHLALLKHKSAAGPAEAVRTVREFLRRMAQVQAGLPRIIEVEVDDLDQLREAFDAEPDLVLLDNMSLDQLRAAVELRNRTRPHVQLEASGGVTLEMVRAIAETGVDRISIGALTHSATSLDFGMDWRSP